jgi:DNA-directed RNA polymerase subunit RPC12/RpoP
METSYRCPDCSAEHDEPGEATLGHQVRCLDCQIEIDLALELKFMPIPQIAA